MGNGLRRPPKGSLPPTTHYPPYSLDGLRVDSTGTTGNHTSHQQGTPMDTDTTDWVKVTVIAVLAYVATCI